jgi:hypothetical protein
MSPQLLRPGKLSRAQPVSNIFRPSQFVPGFYLENYLISGFNDYCKRMVIK